MASIVQYYPETFRFYWITKAIWLDPAIIAGLSFAVSVILLKAAGKRKSSLSAH